MASKSKLFAELLDANGDVELNALDNVSSTLGTAATADSTDFISSTTDDTASGVIDFNPTSGSVPFTVNSGKTSVVTNLNADRLDGIEGSKFDQLTSFVATGNITSGDIVSLRTDGTVESVSSSISADSFGSAAPLAPFEINTQYTYDTTNNRYVANGFFVAGSPVNYITVGQIDSANNTVINGSITTISDCAISVSTYDSYNNRIVIAYVEISTGDGKYLVGEVNSSNNTITFGSAGTFDTAINFSSRATALDITYDSFNRKIVICYVDGSNSDYPTVIVGEVNPTTNTLTLGTPTVPVLPVSARLSTNTNPSVSMVFDPSRNHIAVCYTQDINPGWNYIIIDSFTTNSNNSITPMHTFGNQFINTEVHGIELLYDPSTTNYLVTYVDYTNNEYPTAVVCTYTSNGIIFNTPVVLSTELFDVDYVDTSFLHYGMRGVYSQAANKFIIALDFTTSTKNEFIYGTITNNNTFTVDPIYDSAIDDGSYQGWLEDPVSLKLVFSYWDGGRTQQHVYTPKQISTNAGSWIGIAAEDIVSTSSGNVYLNGNVASNLSSLTIGSEYYVDYDGTLTTISTDYGKIGKAIATNKLLITQ